LEFLSYHLTLEKCIANTFFVIAIIRGIKTLPTLNENCWDPRIAVTSHLSCTGQRVGMDGIAIQQQLEWNPG